eukprot:jgi/Tetstr1/429156/TSEL_019109.t1
MPQTASTNLRERQPTHAEWYVAAAMEDVLSHPCKLVKLAQSNGSHWLLSDALYSIVKLEAKYTEIRNQSVAISATRPNRADEDDGGDEQFNSDLKTQSDAMIDPILSEVNNMMAPFRTFDHDRRHESLRNKMGVENMATQVFIHKNVDLGAQVGAALSYNFGKECYMLSVKPDIKIRSEVQEAAALLDSASAEVTADSEASSTVEARISCAEYVQSRLDDSAAIES